MSLNWVMLAPGGGFVKLPKEQILFTSPPRTSLSLSSPNTFPGTQPWSAQSDGGRVYVTNQRIVYLPSKPTEELKSFSAPILNLQDSYVRAPFFGANYWCALVKPVAGGNIPPNHPIVEIKMTFREGGAFDYHSIYEQIRERLHNALQMAREEGQDVRSTSDLDLDNVHLEQLPAYEAAREVSPSPRDRVGEVNSHNGAAPPAHGASATQNPPDDPPPDYDEAQAQALRFDFDQRLREEAERT